MRWTERLFGCVMFSLLILGLAGCSQQQQTELLTPSEETGATVVELSSHPTDASQGVSDGTTGASSGISSPTAAVAHFTALPEDPFGRTKTIQTALKQAGYYTGNIDGKGGPLTQKAIEDFQRAKGLKADGKVGPITWGELAKYSLPENE